MAGKKRKNQPGYVEDTDSRGHKYWRPESNAAQKGEIDGSANSALSDFSTSRKDAISRLNETHPFDEERRAHTYLTLRFDSDYGEYETEEAIRDILRPSYGEGIQNDCEILEDNIFHSLDNSAMATENIRAAVQYVCDKNTKDIADPDHEFGDELRERGIDIDEYEDSLYDDLTNILSGKNTDVPDGVVEGLQELQSYRSDDGKRNGVEVLVEEGVGDFECLYTETAENARKIAEKGAEDYFSYEASQFYDDDPIHYPR